MDSPIQSFHYTKNGFTIVELLIVIVVIGILAAITIVAYSGVQNRANDTTIKSDMKNLGQRLELYYVDAAVYPYNWDTMSMKVSKTAYGANYVPTPGSEYNLIYCRNDSTFAIAGGSKSGKTFSYRPGVGVSEYPGNLATYTTTCNNLGVSTVVSGWSSYWLYSTGVWSGSLQ